MMTALGESVERDHQGRAVGVVRTLHEVAAFVWHHPGSSPSPRGSDRKARWSWHSCWRLGLMPVFVYGMIKSPRTRLSSPASGAANAQVLDSQ